MKTQYILNLYDARRSCVVSPESLYWDRSKQAHTNEMNLVSLFFMFNHKEDMNWEEIEKEQHENDAYTVDIDEFSEFSWSDIVEMAGEAARRELKEFDSSDFVLSQCLKDHNSSERMELISLIKGVRAL